MPSPADDPPPPRTPWAALAALSVGIGAFLTLCDWACHVQTGVLRYTVPEAGSLLPGQPTAQVFVGFLGVGAFCAALGWALFRGLAPAGVPRTLASTAAFAASYAASGLLQDWPMTLYVLFLGTWAAHLVAFREGLHRLVAFCVLLGVLGPVVEGAYSTTGFFAYRDAVVFHVPAWLTGVYFHGGLAVAALVSTLAAAFRDAPADR